MLYLQEYTSGIVGIGAIEVQCKSGGSAGVSTSASAHGLC